jgi:hypothetical protein
MSYAAKRPDIEIKRRIRRGPHRGATRSYATVYRKPLAVWVLGHWIVGGKPCPRGLGGRGTRGRSHMKRKPCPNEAAHNDDGPRDYMSRAEWAENKLKTHDQKQCPGCGLWLIWGPKVDAALTETEASE